VTVPMRADADQVAAYWTRMAYESIIAFTRREQAKRGFSQPQFWILRHLSPDDLSSNGEGMTVPQLERAMTAYIRPEDDLSEETEALVARGWLRRNEDGRLWPTADGEAARLEMKQYAPEIRAMIHAGVDDADYVKALQVLQKLIANTTADA
jgi:hypothetical protein